MSGLLYRLVSLVLLLICLFVVVVIAAAFQPFDFHVRFSGLFRSAKLLIDCSFCGDFEKTVKNPLFDLQLINN